MRSLFAVAALLAGCRSSAADQHAATTQRGTVSSDTSTTAAGTLEVEAGVTIDWQDQLDFPAALKWGPTHTTELYLGWSPYQRLDLGDDDGDGIGDLVLGGRWRFLELTPEHPAAAVQLETKFPVGDDDLSSGEVDYQLAGMVGGALGRVGLTGFYQLGALGEEDGRGVDVQHTLALTVGVPIHAAWKGYAEAVWTTIYEQDIEAGALQAGAYYEAGPSLVLDAGLALGFGPDAPDVLLLFGFTKNLGHLRERESHHGP